MGFSFDKFDRFLFFEDDIHMLLFLFDILSFFDSKFCLLSFDR